MRRGAFHGRHCTQSPPFYFSPLTAGGLRHRADAAGRYEIEAADCGSTAATGGRMYGRTGTGLDAGRTRRHILITGSPGVGKTTLIASIVERLPGTKTGFFTREVRRAGVRKGFTIQTLDNRSAPLAQAASVGSPRVGKYRVNTESVRDVAVPAILAPADFISIDEIGKMETACESFNQAVSTVLARPSTVIGMIAERGNPFIEGITLRQDVLLITVTRENRASITDERLRSVTHFTPAGR